MTVSAPREPSSSLLGAAAPKAAHRATPLRAFAWIYFFSGFSSLIYQVVWQRALSTYFGVGPVSTTIIVSVFMAGLGIGSYLGGVLSRRVRDPVTAYFVAELTLGLFGATSLLLLSAAGALITQSAFGVGVIVVAAFLLFPTVLMGLTFPLLTQAFIDRDPRLGAAVSRLYFVNSLGAALGTLLTSVILISFFGLDVALYVAALTNLGLALAIQLARRITRTWQAPPARPPRADPLGRFPSGLVFVTGFLAIGYQMLWYRLVGILVKDSPYAFSGILSTYLLGIACGSAWLLRKLDRADPGDLRRLYFVLQLSIGLYAAGITVLIYLLRHTTTVEALLELSFKASTHPPRIGPDLFTHPARMFLSFDIFWWSLLLFFPATLAMGAAFPLAPLLINRDLSSGGATVGKVYFLNVAGNVAGGILTGFWLLPALGTEHTLLLFTSVSLAYVSLIDRLGPLRPSVPVRVGVSLALICALWLFGFSRGDLMRALHARRGGGTTYFDEGVEGTVLVHVDGPAAVSYLNGQRHGGRPHPSFFLEGMEAAAFARSTKRALFIGYGTGSTMEALLQLPELEEIVLVELNATLMRTLQRVPLFQQLLAAPRIHLVIADGRQYLLEHAARFDLVLLDPLRSTTAYSNNLNSREFFTLVNDHLSPGGVMMLWQDEFDILPRTVRATFSHVRQYGYFLLAGASPLIETPGRRAAILHGLAPELRDAIVQFAATLPLPATLEGLSDAAGPINTDWKPRTEYYLGWPSTKYFGDLLGRRQVR